MNDTQQYAEALIAENGKITFVGAAAEAQQKITADSSVIDLNGNTMLPGFYDAHSHFAQTGTLLSTTIDLSPFPFGEMTNWQSCLTRLKTAAETLQTEAWLIARGFEESVLEQDFILDKTILDEISTTHPVVIAHNSGHLFYVNSKALDIMQYQYDTPDPQGGKIKKDETAKTCTGILEGTAGWPILQQVSKLSEQDLIKAITEASALYAQQGVTTVNEGEAIQNWQYAAYLKAIEQNQFPLQAIVNPRYEKRELAEPFYQSCSTQLKIQGWKLIVDGSIQTGSAYLSQPYYLKQDTGDCGYMRLEQQQLKDILLEAYAKKIQVYAHCNGVKCH